MTKHGAFLLAVLLLAGCTKSIDGYVLRRAEIACTGRGGIDSLEATMPPGRVYAHCEDGPPRVLVN